MLYPSDGKARSLLVIASEICEVARRMMPRRRAMPPQISETPLRLDGAGGRLPQSVSDNS